jgi:hypothetical protein
MTWCNKCHAQHLAIRKLKWARSFKPTKGRWLPSRKVGLDSVTVDANHPLAGVELNFAVEVLGNTYCYCRRNFARPCAWSRWPSSLIFKIKLPHHHQFSLRGFFDRTCLYAKAIHINSAWKISARGFVAIPYKCIGSDVEMLNII